MLKDNEYFDSDDVKNAVRGRWPLALGSLLPDGFQTALQKPGKQVPCPHNGGKTRFRFFRDSLNERGSAICNCCGAFSDGFEVLMWANKWDFRTAFEAVGETLHVQPKTRLNGTPAKPRSSVVVPEIPRWAKNLQERMAKVRTVSPERARSKILAVWNEGQPLTSPEAAPFLRYLMKDRGIRLRVSSKLFDPEHLRFHPALPYYEETVQEVNGVETSKWVCLGEYPAFMGALRNTSGELVTVHRTYLTPEGHKAPVDSSRKMMAAPSDMDVNGCSIKLGDPVSGVLGLCEGKETGWAAMSATGIGVHSLVNTTLMAGYEVPPVLKNEVHTFIIWQDKDVSKAGEEAANTLKDRLEAEGFKVFVFEPAMPIPVGMKSVDWNDVLKTQGVLGFPDLRFLRRTSPVRRQA